MQFNVGFQPMPSGVDNWRQIFFSWLVGLEHLIVKVSWSHSIRHTTLGRIPLDKWSARRIDLHLITHNTHKRWISMTPAGSEPAIPVSERTQTHALNRAVTVIGTERRYSYIFHYCSSLSRFYYLYMSRYIKFSNYELTYVEQITQINCLKVAQLYSDNYVSEIWRLYYGCFHIHY